MEISGKIIAILEPRSGQSKSTGNNWMSQEYVLETSEQYPKRVCFNIFGEDKIRQFNIVQGQEYTVSFDINAREYQGRWYNDVRAWKVEPYVPGAMPASPIPAAAPAQFQTAAPAADGALGGNLGDQADDLPF